MSWIAPITTHVDGEAYGYEDMNRVGNDIQYLAGLLNGYGYPVTVAPKTDWVRGQIPTPTQITRYLADLNALKTTFYGVVVLPASMEDFEEVGANNIEKLLIEIEANINGMVAAFRHSGATISGMEGLRL